MKAYFSLASATTLLLASSAFSLKADAANRKIDKRWFEVEVILFRQLDDKNKLKEQFSPAGLLPNYPTFDLLSSYLQPDLSAIKIHAPSCHAKQYPVSYAKQATKLAPLHELLSLDEIAIKRFDDEAVTDDLLQNGEQANTFTSIDDIRAEREQLTSPDDLALAEESTTEASPVEQNTIQDTTIEDVVNDGTTDPALALSAESLRVKKSGVNDPSMLANQSLDNFLETAPTEPGITEEEIALVHQANTAFAQYTFEYSDVNKRYFNYVDATTNRTTATLCVNPNEDPLSASLGLASPEFSQDDFPIDEFTGRVNAAEFVYTDNPYLISSDSLQLKDIYLQLRRSKNFRPLLHLGWRQSLINRKPASKNKALKVFTGEHFEQTYETQKNRYQQSLNDFALEQWLAQQYQNHTDIEEANLNSVNNSSVTNNAVTTSEEQIPTQLASPTELKLNHILSQLDAVELNREQLLADLDRADLHADIIAQLDSEKSDSTSHIKEPIAPVQPWYIDGLFRLHLSHYLYITADFNVSNFTSAELATRALAETQSNNAINQQDWISIPFKQNRRVISGEVHYFDHPYMGMIVQIRRYKKPKPDIEE